MVKPDQDPPGEFPIPLTDEQKEGADVGHAAQALRAIKAWERAGRDVSAWRDEWESENGKDNQSE